MQLPNWQRATIDRRKLRDYVLNPAHPEAAAVAPESEQVGCVAVRRLG